MKIPFKYQSFFANMIEHPHFFDQLINKTKFRMFALNFDNDQRQLHRIVKDVSRLKYKQFIQKHHKQQWINKNLTAKDYEEIALQILSVIFQLNNQNHFCLKHLLEIIQSQQYSSIQSLNSVQWRFLKNNFIDPFKAKIQLEDLISYHFKHNQTSPKMLQVWEFNDYFVAYNQLRFLDPNFMNVCIRISNFEFQHTSDIQNILNDLQSQNKVILQQLLINNIQANQNRENEFQNNIFERSESSILVRNVQMWTELNNVEYRLQLQQIY